MFCDILVPAVDCLRSIFAVSFAVSFAVGDGGVEFCRLKTTQV